MPEAGFDPTDYRTKWQHPIIRPSPGDGKRGNTCVAKENNYFIVNFLSSPPMSFKVFFNPFSVSTGFSRLQNSVPKALAPCFVAQLILPRKRSSRLFFDSLLCF